MALHVVQQQPVQQAYAPPLGPSGTGTGAPSRTPAPAQGLTDPNAPPTAGAEDDGFSFWDFLDIINPLQHIPVVNTIYRELTGDEIGAPARMIGGALFGGPVGFGMSVVNEMVRDNTGKDIGEHVMAAFLDDGPDGAGPGIEPPVQVASNDAARREAAQSAALRTEPPPGPPPGPPPPASGEDAPITTAEAVPLISLKPGFSPYNQPSRPVAPKSGGTYQASHPLLDLGPSAQVAANAGRLSPGTTTAIPARSAPPPAHAVAQRGQHDPAALAAATGNPAMLAGLMGGQNTGAPEVTMDQAQAANPGIGGAPPVLPSASATGYVPMFPGATDATGGASMMEAMNAALDKYEHQKALGQAPGAGAR